MKKNCTISERMSSLYQTNRRIKDMLASAARSSQQADVTPRAFKAVQVDDDESTVCSVQRMLLSEVGSAASAVEAYFQWLTETFKGVIRVKPSPSTGEIEFVLGLTGHKLLGLKRIEARSTPDRQVLRITPGLLAIETPRGRLEFRQVMNSQVLITAIHDFRPRLPWWLYRITQGFFHDLVMKRFGAQLSKSAPRLDAERNPRRS